MKKILVTTAICLIGAASMMAQGRINFANTSTSPIRISASPDGSASVVLGTASTAQFGFGPASVRIQLFAGLTSTALSPVLLGTGATAPSYATNTANTALAAVQGTFSGGSNIGLPGYDGSAPVYLQFVATPINPAFSQYRGESSIIQVNLATGLATATAVFGANATASLWNGVTLTPPVPEPSSMALAGLGAASLLIFRRRK